MPALLECRGGVIDPVVIPVEEEFRGCSPAAKSWRNGAVALATSWLPVRNRPGERGLDLPSQVRRVGVAWEIALEVGDQGHAAHRVGADLDDARPVRIRQPDALPEEEGVRLHGLDGRRDSETRAGASRRAVRLGPSR